MPLLHGGHTLPYFTEFSVIPKAVTISRRDCFHGNIWKEFANWSCNVNKLHFRNKHLILWQKNCGVSRLMAVHVILIKQICAFNDIEHNVFRECTCNEYLFQYYFDELRHRNTWNVQCISESDNDCLWWYDYISQDSLSWVIVQVVVLWGKGRVGLVMRDLCGLRLCVAFSAIHFCQFP